ncbi:MAG: hypothetical protein K0U70_15475 [Actinomycetia bacterium]|nr:hypothetical protein [Actinomycetes bacterium]MCH9769186.1 hypothetical protein [Actinomycetes bacterium]
MLTVYLCGALITAVAAIGGSAHFSDPRTPVSPVTRVVVAVLAGALWPVIAVGALLLIAAVPLLESLGTAPAAKIKTAKRHRDSDNASRAPDANNGDSDPRPDLVLTG